MTELVYVSSSNGEFSEFESLFPYQIKRPPKWERDKPLCSVRPTNQYYLGRMRFGTEAKFKSGIKGPFGSTLEL